MQRNIEIPRERYQSHSVSGVYFLFDGDDLVYIGRAANIAKRVGEHSSNRYGKKFDSYTFIPCEYQEAQSLEIHLIREHNPKYNEQYAKVEQHIAFTPDLGGIPVFDGTPHKPECIRPRKSIDLSSYRGMVPVDSPLSDYYWSCRLGIDEKHVATMRRKRAT